MGQQPKNDSNNEMLKKKVNSHKALYLKYCCYVLHKRM